MGKAAGKLQGIKEAFKNDENFSRGIKGIVRGAKALPSATGRYFIQKVPVVRWIPQYSPKWLLDDVIAGVTVALVIVPQALASAVIAGVPLEQGLFASWLPSAIYFFMGTSKGNLFPVIPEVVGADDYRYCYGSHDISQSTYQCRRSIHCRRRRSSTTGPHRFRSLVCHRPNVFSLRTFKPRMDFEFRNGSYVGRVPNGGRVVHLSSSDSLNLGRIGRG